MEQYALDISLEIAQGSLHNLGDVILWCRLFANTYNPLQLPPKILVVQRTPQQWSPPTVTEPEIDPQKVAELVQGLKALNWPGRNLKISGVKTDLSNWQETRLRVWLNGQEGECWLNFQFNEIKGEDAPGLRLILAQLLNLCNFSF